MVSVVTDVPGQRRPGLTGLQSKTLSRKVIMADSSMVAQHYVIPFVLQSELQITVKPPLLN